MVLVSFALFTGLIAAITYMMTRDDDHASSDGYFLADRTLYRRFAATDQPVDRADGGAQRCGFLRRFQRDGLGGYRGLRAGADGAVLFAALPQKRRGDRAAVFGGTL